MYNSNFISNIYIEQKYSLYSKEYPRNIFDWYEDIKKGSSKLFELCEAVEGVLSGLGLDYVENKEKGVYSVYADTERNQKAFELAVYKELSLVKSKGLPYREDFKVIKNALENNSKFAVITDGFIWKIYNLTNIDYYDNYIELDMERFIKGEEVYTDVNLFFEILSAKNHFKSDGKSEIEKIFDESAKEVEKLEKSIKSKIEDLLTGISYGFKENINKERLTEDDRRNIYVESIVLLYRILFVFYAESRNLFPEDNDKYKEKSISKLVDKAKLILEKGEIVEDNALGKDMKELFDWINNGSEEAGIIAYNGGLFSNEGRKILGTYIISSDRLANILREMAYNKDKDGLYSIKINYKDLTVRNLGTFYEGILEYNLFIAEETLLKREKNGKVEYIPKEGNQQKKTDKLIEKGEVYLSQDARERKETGSYYTPEEIVEYIVSNTADKKLEELTDEITAKISEFKRDRELLISEYEKEAVNRKIVEELDSFIKTKVLKISVLDNAMGSGHFLVNATLHIANYIMKIIYENIDFIVPEEYENIGDYNYWKRMSAGHSIYGVDINELAVQLGKLSLWLVCAAKDKPLSFLDHHLKCGNSLIGTEEKEINAVMDTYMGSEKKNLFNKVLQSKIEGIKADYDKLANMSENSADEVHEKEGLYNTIRKKADEVKEKFDIYLGMVIEGMENKIKAEKTEQAFAEIAEKNIVPDETREKYGAFAEKYKFFHWELEFPEVFFGKESGGFDCVIGNPPYGAKLGSTEKSLFKEVFSDVHMRTPDTFNYYISNTLKLLKKNERLSFIIPNNILFQNEFSKTRELLLTNNKIDTIINMGDRVFESADVPTCIIVVKKSLVENYDFKFIDLRNEESFVLNDRFQEFNNNSVMKVPAHIIGVDLDTMEIINKVESKSILLDKIVEEVASGISTGGDKTFRINEEVIEENRIEEELLEKVLVGREMNRYKIENTNHKIIYIDRNFEDSKFINTINYLSKFQSELMKRSEVKSGVLPWFSLNRQRYKELFTDPKIILRQTADKVIATYDDEGYFVLDSILVLKLKDDWKLNYKFILGVLNSKLSNYIYRQLTQEEGRTFAQVKPKNIRKLYIPKTQFDKYIEIIVDYILFLNQNRNAIPEVKIMVEYFERIIDAIVYEIYFEEDLSKDNFHFVKIIEQEEFKSINEITEDKYSYIERLFNKINDKNHLLKKNIFYLDSIKIIRKIEGK